MVPDISTLMSTADDIYYTKGEKDIEGLKQLVSDFFRNIEECTSQSVEEWAELLIHNEHLSHSRLQRIFNDADYYKNVNGIVFMEAYQRICTILNLWISGAGYTELPEVIVKCWEMANKYLTNYNRATNFKTFSSIAATIHYWSKHYVEFPTQDDDDKLLKALIELGRMGFNENKQFSLTPMINKLILKKFAPIIDNVEVYLNSFEEAMETIRDNSNGLEIKPLADATAHIVLTYAILTDYPSSQLARVYTTLTRTFDRNLSPALDFVMDNIKDYKI